MSPVDALMAARAAGIQISIDGDDLMLESTAEPPVAVVDLLTEHKAGILTILRSGIGSAPIIASADTTCAGSADIAGPTPIVATGGIVPSTDISASGGTIASTNISASGDIISSGDTTRSAPIIAAADIAAADIAGSASAAADITGSAVAVVAATAAASTLIIGSAAADIIAPRRPQGDEWSTEDWQAFFDEHAGIAEFHGGLPRPEAEARAFEFCVGEWLSRNAVSSAADRCLLCGDADHPNDPLWPTGIASADASLAWLHRECSTAWSTARKAEAVAALASLGIRSPGGNST